MVAVEQLTSSEGTKHGVNSIVHDVVCTDWRHRVTLHTTVNALIGSLD